MEWQCFLDGMEGRRKTQVYGFQYDAAGSAGYSEIHWSRIAMMQAGYYTAN